MGTVKIGVAGWSYKDWQGIVYPESLDPKTQVGYLSQFFDLIEINSSFYGHIKPAIGKRWCRMASSANPNFTFTAKLSRAFTHSPYAVIESTSAETIEPGPTDERDAKAGLDSIAEEGMLGAVLVQFPISFKCTDENRAHVERLVQQFRAYPLVLEVRHASWNQPEVLAWLTALNIGLCNIDQPLLGSAIQPAAEATSPIGYIRLHGRNYKQWFAETNVRDRYNYLYTPKELEGWKNRALEVASKTKQTFVVANNHNLGKAAVNALELISMIEHHKVKAPAPLILRYPELKPISVDASGLGQRSVDHSCIRLADRYCCSALQIPGKMALVSLDGYHSEGLYEHQSYVVRHLERKTRQTRSVHGRLGAKKGTRGTVR